MFKVSTIGSCRIATPVRLSLPNYGLDVNRNRNYGFCHTSAEAVQQLRFLQGKFTPSETIWPLIARGQDRDVMLSQTHQASDLYVVEIASAKRVMHGDTSVQLNYLSNEFREFFADKDRSSEFWSIARTDGALGMDEFLRVHWSDTPEQQADARILREIRMSMTTEEELRQDIRFLIDNTPNVLFVTHVNALKLDGRPIQSRSDLISLVTKVVNAEGGVVYNPTARMIELSQAFAIEDDSTSLAHFTDEFCHVLFWDWYELSFQAAIDAKIKQQGMSAITEVLKPNVTALLQADLTIGLSDRLENLSVHFGAPAPIVLLQSELDLMEDTPDRALERLSDLYRNDPTETFLGERLIQASIRSNRADLVLETLESMLAHDCFVNDKIIFEYANLLHSKGKVSEATDLLVFGQKLLGAQMSSEQAHTYCEMVIQTDPDSILGLSTDAQNGLLRQLTGAIKIKLALLVNHDDVVALCREEIASLTADKLHDLLTDLTANNNIKLAVEILTAWRGRETDDRLMHLGLRNLVDGWFKAVEAEDTKRDDRVKTVFSIFQSSPSHGPSRIFLRNARRDFLYDVRAAYTAKDLGLLLSLGGMKDSFPQPVYDFDILAARLSSALEEYEETIHYTKSALAHDPKNIMMWFLQMRATKNTNDVFMMYSAAQQVVKLASEEAFKFEREAQTRITQTPAMALRAARAEKDPVVAYRLYGLVDINPDYAEISAQGKIKVEAKIVKTVRALEVNDPDDEFVNTVLGALEILPQCESILHSAGRYFVKRRNFMTALPYWERIVQIDPENEAYNAQLQRCHDRSKYENKSL